MSRAVRTRCLSAAFLSFAVAVTAQASEGGASVYVQGGYGDFAPALAAPTGFYFRDDVGYVDGSVGARALGGRVDLGADQTIKLNLAKFAYMSDLKILGGIYAPGIVLPYVLDANATGSASVVGGSAFRSGSTSAQGDIFVAPLQVFWTFGNQHLGTGIAISIPTGRYDEDRLVNAGRNYWATDLTSEYTWLNPARGQEVSFTGGMLFNRENPDTHYRTGDEFHLDWLVAQHFSEAFAVGINGYWYKQVTGDSGQLPAGFNVDNFRGSGAGVGPAALYTFKISERDISLIGKWLHDYHARNRFEGDTIFLSMALKL